MTWNYRILKYKTNTPSGKKSAIYAIHEVYYSKSNTPDSWSKDPVYFACDFYEDDEDKPEEVIKDLERALNSCKKYSILEIVGDRLVDTGVKVSEDI